MSLRINPENQPLTDDWEPASLPPAPEWFGRASCLGIGNDIFFPQRGESNAPARAICAPCPVQSECRGYGLYELFGIWGDTSERQRRRERRQIKQLAKIALDESQEKTTG